MTQRATGRPVLQSICHAIVGRIRSGAAFSVSIVANPVWLVSDWRATGASVIAFMSAPPDPSSTGEYWRSSPTALCPESQGATAKVRRTTTLWFPSFVRAPRQPDSWASEWQETAMDRGASSQSPRGTTHTAMSSGHRSLRFSPCDGGRGELTKKEAERSEMLQTKCGCNASRRPRSSQSSTQDVRAFNQEYRAFHSGLLHTPSC